MDELIERAATAIQRWHHENGKLRPSWQEAQGQARAVVEAALTTIQDREATLIRVLGGLVQEFEKFSRYGSPIAMQANEAMRAAKDALGTSGLVERSADDSRRPSAPNSPA